MNPLKCTFGVASKKFLSFMINHRGIEANLEKIQAFIDMQSPSKMKEVQSLTGRVVALSRFILRAIDKCLPFFDSLKGNKRFLWMTSANRHLGHSKSTQVSHLYSQNLSKENRYTYT